MSQVSRIFLIFHGRFPSEKAAALFAAKSTEALLRNSRPAILLVPRRLGRVREEAREYYKLSRDIDVVFLPTLDLFWIPRFGRAAFYVSFFCFSISACAYLLFSAKKEDVIYSNESLPLYLSTFFFRRTVYELHDFPLHFSFFFRSLLLRSLAVVTTNEWKKAKLMNDFSAPEEKILVEQNAVDIEMYDPDLSKEEARERLSLPRGSKIVVYTGHLYSWKGVDTLALASDELADAVVFVVGGTADDVEWFRAKHGGKSNLRVVGHRPHEEMPLWQRAADVLVLPNTGREEISSHYTSPMKLFEYMASGTPIVASDIPSIAEIISEREAVLVDPDDAHALSGGLQRALIDTESLARAERARRRVSEHTWNGRAKRVLKHIDQRFSS